MTDMTPTGFIISGLATDLSNLNGKYVINKHRSLNGHPTYWKSDHTFIYYQSDQATGKGFFQGLFSEGFFFFSEKRNGWMVGWFGLFPGFFSENFFSEKMGWMVDWLVGWSLRIQRPPLPPLRSLGELT